MRPQPPSNDPHPDWKYIADTVQTFDPEEPAIQYALTGYLRSFYQPRATYSEITVEWGAYMTEWCIRAAQYAAFEPSTLTHHDVWALHQGVLAHPDWFTPDQIAWIEKRVPWAIVHAAIA